MRKLKFLISSLLIIFLFTACSSQEVAEEVFEGEYEGLAIEITPPEGWTAKSYETGVAFAPLSSTEMLSTITVQEHTNHILDEMLENKDSVKQGVIDEFSALSEDINVSFETFEERVYNGERALYVLLNYTYNGTQIKQEQIVMDTSTGSVSLTFSQVGEEDFEEEYEEVIASIKIS